VGFQNVSIIFKIFQLFLGTMEDVNMDSIVEKKLSHKEQAEKKYGPEKMAEWRSNKSLRNRRRKMRIEHSQEIARLEAIDNGLHGRIRHLENRNQNVMLSYFFLFLNCY
jgi:hypothetical protein